MTVDNTQASRSLTDRDTDLVQENHQKKKKKSQDHSVVKTNTGMTTLKQDIKFPKIAETECFISFVSISWDTE